MNRFTEFYLSKEQFPNLFDEESDRPIAIETALKHIAKRKHQFNKHLSTIKRSWKSSLGHGIDKEEAAAVYLCTETSSEDHVRQLLNDALRSGKEELIKPWSSFLRLLHRALDKLPTMQGTVWRGMHINDAKKLKPDDEIIWWTINSCLPSREDIQPYLTDGLTPYSIDVSAAKQIPSIMGFELPDEILLRPGARLRVVRHIYDASTSSYDIHLKQIIDEASTSADEATMGLTTSSVSGPRERRRNRIASNKTTVAEEETIGNDHSQHGRKESEPEKGDIFFSIDFENGDQYQIIQGKGRKNKYSVFVTRNGKRFENQEANDRATGDGTGTWLNGDEYRGKFKHGMKHGQGTLRCRCGYTYTGLWSNDDIDGKGQSAWPNGQTYSGMHKEGKLTGRGSFTSAKGDKYTGDLIDGKANGKGKRVWSNGDRYEGEFKDDKKHGQGIYHYADGAQYSGGWQNDRMDGIGVLKWPSGIKYEGTFKKGRRDGSGKVTFANGYVQEGKWKNDQFVQA